MRKKRDIQPGKCCHLVSRVAHRAYFLDDEEKSRFVDLLRRVEFFCCVRVLAYGGRIVFRRHISIHFSWSRGETYINTYPEDRKCLEPKRYTKYGINQLSLYACQSAALDKEDEDVLRRERRIVWRSNVAKVGTFTGYTRSVTLVIEPYFTITVGGMNETGKENVKRKKGEANGRK